MQEFTVEYNWLFWLEEGRSSFECATVLMLLLLLLVESFSWGSRNLTCQPPKRDWSLASMTGIVPAGAGGWSC